MSEVRYISLSQIHSNPYQPRQVFEQGKLDELARSIHLNGVIQPIVVRQKDENYYEIVAGERRFRALQQLQWYAAPCIIMNADEQQMARLALIENIQRDDLSPIEEGNAYRQLLRMSDMTQEELAERVGKTQPSIANKMRLLNLSEPVQQAINNRQITERHGRAMLKLNEAQQTEVLAKITDKNLTVAATEKLIEKLLTEKKKSEPRKCFGVSTRIAVNTIRQSVKTLQDAGVGVETSETEDDENYTITIRIKK